MVTNIHLKWLIDEYAINFRKDNWFNPPIEPTNEHITILKVNSDDWEMYEIRVIGANFCQVIKINLFNHLKPSITLGNQKWKGAAPLFIKSDEIIIHKVSFTLTVLDISYNIKTVENNNIEDAIAWVKKYFKEASVVSGFFVSLIRGIKDNRLISNPIQALNQEDDDIVINVPTIKVIKKIILDKLFIIKKKRDWPL